MAEKTGFNDRKSKCSGKFHLDMRRMVADFGGITATARMLAASGNDVSEGAVDVWRRRKAINVTSLLHLAMCANMTNMTMPSTGKRWNLIDYIVAKHEENDDDLDNNKADDL